MKQLNFTEQLEAALRNAEPQIVEKHAENRDMLDAVILIATQEEMRNGQEEVKIMQGFLGTHSAATRAIHNAMKRDESFANAVVEAATRFMTDHLISDMEEAEGTDAEETDSKE